MLQRNVRIVLVQPGEPMNIGAVARAMNNCGFEKLTLVSPQTRDWVIVRRLAVHSEHIIESAQIVQTLQEAIANATWVVGTTSRLIHGRPALSPREVGVQACEEAVTGEVAVVFGCEESGLSNQELLYCHALSSIAATAAQPSFNLAQSVLLYAYEISLAAGLTSRNHRTHAAADRDIASLEEPLRLALAPTGFQDLDRPRHGVLDLLQTLRRARLSRDELSLWQATLWAIANTNKKSSRSSPVHEPGADGQP